MKKLLIVAGDPSGDLLAARLVHAMKSLRNDLHVAGVGGKELERVCDRFLGNIVDQGAFGLPVSPRQISFFRTVLNKVIIKELDSNAPDGVVTVDFYGFNSLVAAAAKERGQKVFYYATPQFWASRPGRAEKLRKSVDLFLCLFPFEMDFFKRRNLPAQFVGHPLIDSLPRAEERPMRIESVVGLLPGSRIVEVRRHLPVIVEACNRISEAAPGTRFILFTVPHISRQLYQDIISSSRKKSQCLIELVEDEGYAWRTQIDLAITASGMETLENALLGIPMVIMYKMNWTFFIAAKIMVKIPHVGMPNVLSGKLLVPELIQHKATPERVAAPIIDWIRRPEERKRVRRELLDLRHQFGENGASVRAARAILEKVA
jgi:lipid-A-disaccharide synthase